MPRHIQCFLVLKLLGRQVILSLQLHQRAGYPPLTRIQLQRKSSGKGAAEQICSLKYTALLKNDQHVEDSH